MEKINDTLDYDESVVWGSHIKSTERAEFEKAAAREIFEEIEKWLATDGTLLIITAKKFAEIKNKYTEE